MCWLQRVLGCYCHSHTFLPFVTAALSCPCLRARHYHVHVRTRIHAPQILATLRIASSSPRSCFGPSPIIGSVFSLCLSHNRTYAHADTIFCRTVHYYQIRQVVVAASPRARPHAVAGGGRRCACLPFRCALPSPILSLSLHTHSFFLSHLLTHALTQLTRILVFF